jgi:hypothetical protein
LHNASLYAATAAVHETHLVQPGGGRGVDVRLDDRGNVARRERVEIQLRPDRNADRTVGHQTCIISKKSFVNLVDLRGFVRQKAGR